MREFKVLVYLRKWWKIIVLFTILCCYLFYNYITGQQSYTAQTLIVYTNTGAVNGLTPSGDQIDPAEIYSPSVIADAIDSAGLDVGLDYVRSHFDVTPFMSEEDTILKEAILDSGKEYTLFTTEYVVSFTMGSAYSGDLARKVLDAVVNSYFQYYGEKYVNITDVPSGLTYLQIGPYDYIEQVQLLDTYLKNIIDYLKAEQAQYPDFLSAKAGMSFGDLLLKYQYLYNTNIDALYAMVDAGALTKDAEVLRAKYRYAIAKLENAESIDKQKLAAIEPLLMEYTSKNEDDTASDIMEVTYNDQSISSYVENDKGDSKTTTYDTLLNSYTQYKIDAALQQANMLNESHTLGIIEKANQPGMNTPEMCLEAESAITRVVTHGSALYEQLKAMVVDHNEYLAVLNLKEASTISDYEAINTKLYISIAFVLLLSIGGVLVIVLARLGEIMRRHLYVDSVTGLPNRASFDQTVESLSKHPLDDNVVMVALRLTNLITINESLGRNAGDLMLRNFGSIVSHCMESYGSICYNGGDTFLGVFANCNKSKAELFLTNLQKTVDNYNKQFSDMPLRLKGVACESHNEGIYDVRVLLKKAIGLLRE